MSDAALETPIVTGPSQEVARSPQRTSFETGLKPNSPEANAALQLEQGLGNGTDPEDLMRDFVENVGDASGEDQKPDKSNAPQKNNQESPEEQSQKTKAEHRQKYGLQADNLEADQRYQQIKNELLSQWLTQNPEPHQGKTSLNPQEQNEWNELAAKKFQFIQERLDTQARKAFQEQYAEDFDKYQKYGVYSSIEEDPRFRSYLKKQRRRLTQAAEKSGNVDVITQAEVFAREDFLRSHPEVAKIYAINDHELARLIETTKEFTSQSNEIIYRFLKNGIITNEPSKDEEWGYPLLYTVRIDEAIQVLEEYKDPKTTKETLSPEVEEDLRKQAEECLNRIIERFIKSGLLPEELQRQIMRLINPSNIEITQEDYHRFIYLKDEFPQNLEDQGVIQVGMELNEYLEKELAQILSENGITLSSEQIRRIALTRGLSHEFGHIVDRVLRLREIERRAISSKNSISQIAIAVDEEMDKTLFGEIAVDDELENILKGEPNGIFTNPSSCYSEKIASGFEIIELREALIAEGLSAPYVKKIMEALSERSSRKFEEFKWLFSCSRAKGLNLETLGEAINNLAYYLKKRERPDLRNLFPISFGIRSIGYYRPLNEDQLRAYISRYST